MEKRNPNEIYLEIGDWLAGGPVASLHCVFPRGGYRSNQCLFHYILCASIDVPISRGYAVRHTISHDWNVRRPRLHFAQRPSDNLAFDVRCADGSPMTIYATEDAAEKLMLALLDILLETPSMGR